MTFATTKATRAKNPPIPPGSQVAQSVRSKLSYSYPASPMNGEAEYTADSGGYTPSVVAYLRDKILRNAVTPKPSPGSDESPPDQQDAEGYWVFPTTTTSEQDPSGVDLMYGGAPDFEKISAYVSWDESSEPHPMIASPYMPNLAVPIHGDGSTNFSPLSDNPNPVVIGADQTGVRGIVSLPPGQGLGHKSNPSQTTIMIKNIHPQLIEPTDLQDVSPSPLTPATFSL